MARRDREINIFNIAFLDVITGAMGAFVLLVVILAPYYTGSDPRSRKAQQEAQSSVSNAQQNVQQAQQSVPQDNQQAQQALKQAQDDLAKAKQQLDAVKQQLDQLTSQNNRLSALDNQQQQQIADLQKQAEQSTQQALDRAEQNMQQADQAMQTDDVEKLKRLLAQARADLQAARQQLDALSQELNQARKDLEQAREETAALRQRLQQAMAEVEDLKKQLADALQERDRAMAEAQQMQQQRDQAVARAQQMQQELAATQQQRDQAVAERNQAESQAGALQQSLGKAAPIPAVWALFDVVATPNCAQTSFTPVPKLVSVRSVANTYGLDAQQANAFRGRGLFLQTFLLGWAEKFPFAQFYIATMPDTGSRLYFGIAAASQPPPGCSVQVKFSINTDLGNSQTNHLSWASPVSPIRDTRPVLFGVVPLSNPKDPSLTPSEIATWAREIGNGSQQ